ncbi:MAG: 2-hydroxyglutaryl-CoA dehydratase [Chloroflexi bacterium]|nr:2-hydroxyglutaryl-CoA dehydratase [Chloroflexota bacterium]
MKAYAGVDIGSVMTKAVILGDESNNGTILGHVVIPTTVSSEKSGLQALEQVLEVTNLRREELAYVLATGYGRISASYAQGTLTEISCHAKGAHFANPEVHTLIDIGGQDCKAIKIGEWSEVEDFAMNDKCAAGTGRFFETLARVFQSTLDDLGPLSLRAKERITITSTCTVFAESEVISLMARGEAPESIINGIHFSFARRIVGLVKRLGVAEKVAMTGGTAKNAGMRVLIEELLETKLVPLKIDPQLTGALGAALFARERSGTEGGSTL